MLALKHEESLFGKLKCSY